MKLVVGLGNPGRQYQGTRHNVGYCVLAELARRFARGPAKSKFHAEVLDIEVDDRKVVLVSPLTYMNLSGTAVIEAKTFFKLENEALLVVCDDLALPLGKLRFRPRGSSGGQKGLEDVIRRLGSDDFPRLRIGIGAPPPQWDAAGYVLSKFNNEEQAEIEIATRKAADAVVEWVRDGIDHAMQAYNG